MRSERKMWRNSAMLPVRCSSVMSLLRTPRNSVGLAVILLLHAMLLALALRPRRLAGPPDARRVLTLWAVPAVSAVPSHRRQSSPEKRPTSSVAWRAAVAPPAAAVPRDVMVVESPLAVAPAVAAVPDPAGEISGPPARGFSTDAAKAMARELAHGWAGDPAQQRPAPHADLGNAISSARRRDCKDTHAAGLLTPLMGFLDSKDSGCKW